MPDITRMKNTAVVYLSLFLLSASIVCFEIVSTRIASVIFVQDYACITISLALLGIGSGSVFSYYGATADDDLSRILCRVLCALGVSVCIFITATIEISVTNPFVFLLLVFVPFFFSGIVYARVYRAYAPLSPGLYAADLSGAGAGAAAALGLISMLGAPNTVLFVGAALFLLSALFLRPRRGVRLRPWVSAVPVLALAALLTNGRNELLGTVPIGRFPEKDFYSVYADPSVRPRIIDSRWSMYGRSDLVQYSDQDLVRQLFVDGAAGTQVYRFNGNVRHTQSGLQELLLRFTNAIPFLCLTKEEKHSMVVIGPGGGKEVLLGLFGEVDTITGVEVNPDFIRIVQDYREFDGGIYSDFANVKIVHEEGRHFIKQLADSVDLIDMALPSTEQAQHIEPFAANENYLLTKEAIEDYLGKLTAGGRLIFTVHNELELMRLIATAVSVFRDRGTPPDDIRNHFAVLEAEYAPTVVIKKTAFTAEETGRWERTSASLPRAYPAVTYLPRGLARGTPSAINRFLEHVAQSPDRVRTYISQYPYDIAPCTDDRPFFYNVFPGVPGEYVWLLVGTVVFSCLVVWLPFRVMSRSAGGAGVAAVRLPLGILVCTGTGFMVLEVSLFQKLILYLGSPTIALSILLCSLLAGMGIGSYCGRNMCGGDIRKRLTVVSIAIVLAGVLLFGVSPVLLSKTLALGMPLRAATCFLVILPLAFFLGIPFPSCIQLLGQGRNDRYIPWMYGVNGSMAVLGSVLAVVLSMLFGFTPAYFAGLFLYACVAALVLFPGRNRDPHARVPDAGSGAVTVGRRA